MCFYLNIFLNIVKIMAFLNQKQFCHIDQVLKNTIKKEIEKAEEQKLTELINIQKEVENIRLLIVKYEYILNNKIELFYNNRVQNLRKLLDDSNVLEKLPNPINGKFGSRMNGYYEKMREDLVSLLGEELLDEAKFKKSDLNGRITIGSVELCQREKVRGKSLIDVTSVRCHLDKDLTINEDQESAADGLLTEDQLKLSFRSEDEQTNYSSEPNEDDREKFSVEEVETNISSYKLVQCSFNKIMVLQENPTSGQKMWINLESKQKKRIKKNKFFINPLNNDITYQMIIYLKDQDKTKRSIYIDENRKIVTNFSIENLGVNLFSSYIVVKENYLYWLNEYDKVFGPNLDNFTILQETILNTKNFYNFLKNAFESEIELLFSFDRIFLINIHANQVNVYLQKNFFENQERIIGSRKLNENLLALVFENITSLKKNLIIKYYKFCSLVE